MECDSLGLPHFAKLFQRQLVEVWLIYSDVTKGTGMWTPGMTIIILLEVLYKLVISFYGSVRPF